jgi:membrane-bound lytic murein transglycosylase D
VGQVYYFKAKKSKAGVHYHIARPGETWWSVAQKYGITKSALLSKNRLRKESALQVGRVLWLRFIRPANIPIAYEQEPVKVCNN